MSYETQLLSADAALLEAALMDHQASDTEASLGLWSTESPSEGGPTDCQYDDWGYPLDEDQHQSFLDHLSGQQGLLSYFDSMSEFDADDYEYQQGLLY